MLPVLVSALRDITLPVSGMRIERLPVFAVALRLVTSRLPIRTVRLEIPAEPEIIRVPLLFELVTEGFPKAPKNCGKRVRPVP